MVEIDEPEERGKRNVSRRLSTDDLYDIETLLDEEGLGLGEQARFPDTCRSREEQAAPIVDRVPNIT